MVPARGRLCWIGHIEDALQVQRLWESSELEIQPPAEARFGLTVEEWWPLPMIPDWPARSPICIVPEVTQLTKTVECMGRRDEPTR